MAGLPQVKSKEELCALVEEIGFLPLFSGVIPGFSVQEIVADGLWWSGDAQRDPWEWRAVIAAEGKIAYGKLFSKKAGYISRAWYPLFATWRRNGYDFEALYEEGLAPRKVKLIYDQLEDGGSLPSYELKQAANFGKDGEKGFEGALTTLQMQMYITVRGFERKRSKTGEEYGWPVGLYSTSEALFGEQHVRSAYDIDPAEAKEQLSAHLMKLLPGAGKSQIDRFLKG